MLFNTNGTLLKVKKSRELIEAGLDELRVSLDAAEAGAYAKIRGRDMFDAIVRNLKGFLGLKQEMGVDASARLALADRPEGDDRAASCLRRLAHRDRASRRCICSASSISPKAKEWRGPPPRSSRASTLPSASTSSAPRTRRSELGVFFDASGASEPEESLTRDVERQALVDVPQALVVDVFHGPWTGAPVLHRALLDARL